MYRIRVGNMYLQAICVSVKSYSINNEFIDSLKFSTKSCYIYDTEQDVEAICDKLYIVLGIKCIIEKVDEIDE